MAPLSPRSNESSAAMSSVSSEKSYTWAFDLIRDAVTDFGMTMYLERQTCSAPHLPLLQPPPK